MPEKNAEHDIKIECMTEERLNKVRKSLNKPPFISEKTPENIIFREPDRVKDFLFDIVNEQKCIRKEDFEIPLNRKILKGIEEIVYGPDTKTSSAPTDEAIINKGEKNTINDSEPWMKEFSKRELKKEIRGQLDELQEQQAKLDKKETRPYWEYSFNKDKQYLIGLGDLHYGAKSCDVAKFKEKVRSIKKYGTAVILMGDLIENANRYSVGAGVYEQVMTPMDQMDDVCKLLEPIKDQCMAMLDGNHEFRTWKECGFRPTQIMADRLDIPYAGFEAFVRMKVKKSVYTVYATHGSTGSRFPWTRMKCLEDIMRNVDSDICLMGHTHDKLYHEMAYKGITPKKKIGVLTGSFLGDDSFGYAAMKNLPPVKTGMIVLELSGKEWDVHSRD